MSMVKIVLGVLILVIGIALWFMISTPDAPITKMFISTPSERFAFTENLAAFQPLYFLITSAFGVLMIIWGARS